MSGKAHLLLLLHMHQPYYLDPISGVYRLPWVRLHAVREYYDVVSLALANETARLTINLVPSLLLQLEDLNRHPERDWFWQLSLADPEQLLEEDKKFLLTNFFLANWKNMIFTMPRFRELLDKRGREIKKIDWKGAFRRFTRQDCIDLQVLFNLVWCGFTAEEEFAEIRELKKKEKYYSEDDRKVILALHQKIIGNIIEKYKQAGKTGRIELSTTPAYHPILPLLIDNLIGLRSDATSPMPKNPFKHPEDARTHLALGRKIFEEIMQLSPNGLWPSEGSVAPEIVPMVQETGFKWMASDEEVARKSLPWLLRDDVVYRPWNVRYSGREVTMVYRDKYLSDLIGFTYSRNPAQAAVEHFVSKLEEIADKRNGAQIAVVLDGENPWEHYENGGKNFLTTLFQEVAKSPKVEMKAISESLAERPPKGVIDNLFSASWINNNFRVWIGGEEENKAWDFLSYTRKVLAEYPNKEDNKYKQAFEAICAAEGSDWFWWYGGKFASETPELFDSLFRAHLRKVFEHLEMPVPDFLKVPILHSVARNPCFEPVDYINPVLDGLVTGYYEWWGAAKVPLAVAGGGWPGGAMVKGTHLLEELYCGFNSENIFFRIDFHENGNEIKRGIASGEIKIEFYLSLPTRKVRLLVTGNEAKHLGVVYAEGTGLEEKQSQLVTNAGEVAMKDVLEVKSPLSFLNLPSGSIIEMALRVLRVNTQSGQEIEIARYPHHGYYELYIPSTDFFTKNWSAI